MLSDHYAFLKVIPFDDFLVLCSMLIFGCATKKIANSKKTIGLFAMRILEQTGMRIIGMRIPFVGKKKEDLVVKKLHERFSMHRKNR